MEIVGVIINLGINIAVIVFIIWIKISLKELNQKIEDVENIKIKHLWDNIDKLEARIKELESKNTPE